MSFTEIKSSPRWAIRMPRLRKIATEVMAFSIPEVAHALKQVVLRPSSSS